MVQKTKKLGATFWMLMPVGLLVTSVSGWLWMVSMAVDDPGFALEPDYYKKASSYDEVINQQERNTQLGYKVRVISFSVLGKDVLGKDAAELIVQVQDRDGRGIEDAELTAEGLFVGRAFRTQKIAFESRGNGIYSATMSDPRTGLWEVRLSVVAEPGVLFTETLRPELSSSSGGLRRKGAPSPS